MVYDVSSYLKDKDLPTNENELKKLVEGVLSDYRNFIKSEVIDGRSVSLEGIGVIKASYRKVKNPMGREFSLKAKLINDKSFERMIINEFKKNPDKFDFNIQ